MSRKEDLEKDAQVRNSGDVRGKIELAAATDIGTVRKENEDFYYYSNHKRFLVVCDGMGGYEKGALASKIAGETLRDLIFSSDTLRQAVIQNHLFDIRKVCSDIDLKVPPVALKLLAGVRLANRRILYNRQSGGAGQGMGTTISAAAVDSGHIHIVHVGDSRVYRLRGETLASMTTDHSWLNELLEDKEIRQEDVEHFQKKNVLTRALGFGAGVEIDLLIEPVEANDLYLICSDGLYNALSDDLIKSVLTAFHGSLENKVIKLVNNARQMNGSDNITGGLMYLSEAWTAPKEVCNTSTVVEPSSEEIELYLDQAVKTIYPPDTQSSKQRQRTRILLAALAGCLALLLVAFMLPGDEGTQAEVETASVQVLTNPLPESRRPVPVTLPAGANGGTLVLLQVSDASYITMLNNFEGLRILDEVARFRQSVPVYAGNFTWAIADSNESIIYKNPDLHILPLERLTAVEEPAALAANRVHRVPATTSRQSNPNTNDVARVFILGNFDDTGYIDAQIFVNDRRYGSLSDVIDNGLPLAGGTYRIEIRDQANAQLAVKSKVVVTSGETVAIEF